MPSSRVLKARVIQPQEQNKATYNGVITRKRAAFKTADNECDNNLNKNCNVKLTKLNNVSEKENSINVLEEKKSDEIQYLNNEPIKWLTCSELNNKEYSSNFFKDLKNRRNKIRGYYSKIMETETPIWFLNSSHDEFMHADYLPSIIDYLMDKECFYEPLGLDYLSESCDINHRHRYTLVDWMIKVHQKVGYSNETLQLSIALMDRFVKAMKHQIKRVDLSIVGAMCMFTASKFEEIYTMTLNDYLEEINVTYDVEKCRMLEEKILSTIDFKLSIPVPLSFIRHYNIMFKADTISHLYSRYFCELSLQDYVASGYSSNMIGASCVLLAQIICQEKRDNFVEVWNPSLQCASGLLFPDLIDLLKNLCIIVSKQQIASKNRAIAVKYSSDCYYRVAEKVIKSVGFISIVQYMQSITKPH